MINAFSFVVVLNLINDQISSLTRYRKLKKLIRRQINDMRICQQDQKCLYSIIHLNHFFIDVVLHLIQTINKSFEFLRSNNFESPLLMKRHDHFRNFFDLCRKLSIEENKIATTIVFAIFLNAYPVRAHDESFMTIKIFFV